jgi:hypothetical protein
MMRSRIVRAGASLREKNARHFSQGPRGKEYAVRVSDFMQQVFLLPSMAHTLAGQSETLLLLMLNT